MPDGLEGLPCCSILCSNRVFTICRVENVLVGKPIELLSLRFPCWEQCVLSELISSGDHSLQALLCLLIEIGWRKSVITRNRRMLALEICRLVLSSNVHEVRCLVTRRSFRKVRVDLL